MGKIAPVSAKYVIYASINIDGVVEKPDVIGAIFGQTEGLLGRDLELRELQKSGRIGRIDVNIDIKDGKAEGEIILPSSLDKGETAIVGAALETIKRIGPCNAHIKVRSVEDVRTLKREYLLNRAKQLLQNIMEDVMPDSQELMEEINKTIRSEEIVEYGSERLPAGPGIRDSQEIIIVEGRADVLNLLKNNFRSVIALNGTSVPKTIVGLCQERTSTLFIDGDRGGDLILKELTQQAELDFIARAPDGKEVEELTSKEIHKALRVRIPIEDLGVNYKKIIKKAQGIQPAKKKVEKEEPKPVQRTIRKPEKKPERSRPRSRERKRHSKVPKKLAPVFKEMLEDLIGTRGAFLLDDALQVLGKVPVAELRNTLPNTENVFATIFDGRITADIVRLAVSKKLKFLVAIESDYKERKPRGLTLLTSADLGL